MLPNAPDPNAPPMLPDAPDPDAPDAPKTGKRIVLAGRLLTKPGQRLAECLPLAERALIRYFLSAGHDLVNKQGTRLRRHELESSGRHPKRFFPGVMYLERVR